MPRFWLLPSATLLGWPCLAHRCALGADLGVPHLGGGSHRDLPGSFLGSPSTERFCTQISSTGLGHPESHGHDQEIRLSDVTSVTEECCGRGRETGDEIPVEGQGWEMKSRLLRGLHK